MQKIPSQYLLWFKTYNYLNYSLKYSFLSETELNCNSSVKVTENAPYGCANGLTCVRYYAETLSKTHAKADQRNAKIKDHFVYHEQHNLTVISAVYQVKLKAGDRGITAENMEKSQNTDFKENMNEWMNELYCQK